MADKKISQLPALQELSGDEQIPVSKEGANYKVSAEDLSKGNVRYDEAQELTTSQQLQARANIAAMANTPSGDPMHYMYEQAGAVWNAETGYWELNTLTDLTTAEMRQIYAEAHLSKGYEGIQGFWNNIVSRTNISNTITVAGASYRFAFTNAKALQVARLSLTNSTIIDLYECFNNCTSLKQVFGKISLLATSVSNAFRGCISLETVLIENLKVNISFADSPNFSVESGAYIINHNIATNTITITVHHDAYVRFMADPTIQEALEAHPNVTLADAGATD